MDRHQLIQGGKYLRRLRETRGRSLIEVESVAGLSDNQISRLERGANSPTFEAICALASYYNVQPNSIAEEYDLWHPDRASHLSERSPTLTALTTLYDDASPHVRELLEAQLQMVLQLGASMK